MADPLALSRQKLKDIAAANRRGVHRPELVVAARDEINRLTALLADSPVEQHRPIEQLIERYRDAIARLIG